ncbi:MAG: hypothetical protein H7319_01210 [Spirosoma sp.]|nr:hypothetical protein [Spirosoma sp.]
MLRSTTALLLFALFITACKQPQDKAKQLINEATAAHGGDAYRNKRIEFDFRKFHIMLETQDGKFRYERTYQDSTGTPIREVLTNANFSRFLDGQPQQLDTAQVGKYSRAVNSVAYFVLLPYKLNDPAVLSEYVGEETVDGKLYDKVRVNFRAEGGGKDYQDTFCYWINRETHTMDYLAYSEGGPRFRKAINPQTVGGIRFQDYINYEAPKTDTSAVSTYDQKYTAGQLTELSRIEQKNIRVTDLP